jgi:hypothetical protein
MLREQQSIAITIFSTLVPAFSFLAIISLLAGSVSAQSGPNAAPGSASSTYRLIGTVEGGSFTGAVLDDTAGKQSFYRLRELLPDGSRVVKVRSDSILLKQVDGTLYELFITRDTKTAVQANPLASVRPAAPFKRATTDPYAPGAIRNIEAEQPNSNVQRRGRVGRKQSEE